MVQRSTEREYMDDHTPSRETLQEVYAFLGAINRWLGGSRATLARFDQFSRMWEPGARIEVLDVACGGGDLARDLVAWGRARRFDIRVTAFDISPDVLACARRRGTVDPRLGFLCGDVHRLPCRDGGFDYVICTLFFHHLTDAEVVRTLLTFNRIATRGIVVNDLIRRRRHYIWSWLLTRPFNEVLRNDGPLSVRRAFRADELSALAHRAGMEWLSIGQHFGHRMTLAGERPHRGYPSAS